MTTRSAIAKSLFAIYLLGLRLVPPADSEEPVQPVQAAGKEVSARPSDTELEEALRGLVEGKKMILTGLEEGWFTPRMVAYDWKTFQSYLKTLSQRWDDPRSEKMLEELYGNRKKYQGCEFKTPCGHAYDHLLILRANKTYHALLNGLENPEERVNRIRQAFREDPELVYPTQSPENQSPLRYMLLEEADKLAGPAAIDLLIEACYSIHADREEYRNAAVEYARKSGPEKFLSSKKELAFFIEYKDPKIIPLLEEWLKDAKDLKDMEKLAEAIIEIANSRSKITELINDHRQPVAQKGVEWLINSVEYWDEEFVKVLERKLQQLEQEGAPQEEIKYWYSRIKIFKRYISKP